jgi:hypothetical protein
VQHSRNHANPAQNVAKIAETKSFESWSQAEIELFKNSNPPRWMLTAFMLASYASPRRRDVPKMRREQYDGTGITLRVSKRRKRQAVKDLYIPCRARI